MKWPALLLLFLIHDLALAFELPPEFQANYDMEKYGSIVATSSLSLSRSASADNKGQTIIYTSASEPRGLAAIFSNDRITETSTLIQHTTDDIPLLQEYRYSRKKKPEDNQQITISRDDNNQAHISSHYKNQSAEFNETQTVWDILSVQLALMDAVRSAKKGDVVSYRVINKNRLTDYSFEYLDDEQLTINSKTYSTKKLKRVHSSGKRITIMWLASDLSYIPVAIEQHKDDKLHWQMKLQKIHLEKN